MNATCHSDRKNFGNGLCRQCYQEYFKQKQNKPQRQPGYTLVRKNLTGLRFGRLTVIKQLPDFGARNYVKWLCRCDCGKECSRRGNHLSDGATKSCGCIKAENNRKMHLRTYKEIPGVWWSTVQSRCKHRNMEFSITIEYVYDLFVAQNRKCAMTGVPIAFTDRSASLDRIDSKLGYTPDNVQWVHKTINLMKNFLTVTDFKTWCTRVASYAP